MDAVTARLLNEFQHDFPLVPRPFQSVAARLGASEPEVLAMLASLVTSGKVSRVGLTFAPGRIGAATLAEALNHPTWTMGRKITVDSATLANKALEVIEAHFLFGLPYDRIDVVVHPQSIVHSMVEFVDGSVLAQVGVPSMELPILYALTHPERLVDADIPRFDPVAASPLTFEPVRLEAFPALRLGIEAGRAGGVAPAVFNAANEAAVALFLDGRIAFAEIGRGIERALAHVSGASAPTRDDLMDADRRARAVVGENR